MHELLTASAPPPPRRPTRLNDLAAIPGVRRLGLPVDGEVTGVTVDSTSVRSGDLYAALPGANVHGAAFGAEAAAAGAVAVLTDEFGAATAAAHGLPMLVADDARAVLGPVAARIHGTDTTTPQLFAVTGTNGKTTTVHVLDALLRRLGLVSALSATTGRRIADEAIDGGLTTPEASELHALLARMNRAGVQAAAVEVSAQSLSRHRVDAVRFDVAGSTTLSHDHLDDYPDMRRYLDAKAALFDPERAKGAVVCTDTGWGAALAARSRVPTATLTSLTGVDADWRVAVTQQTGTATAFTLTHRSGGTVGTSVSLVGRHMAVDAGLAIAMLVAGGVSLGRIRSALAGCDLEVTVPGRTERVPVEHGPSVFMDFSHTPESFAATLDGLRRITPGRLLMLFGGDGGRDPSKRAAMGRAAAEHADIVVVTDHHPRFEPPDAIRRVLLEGAESAQRPVELHEVPVPSEAIRRAVALTTDGDAILWAGPGSVDFREVAGTRIPYSARDDARAALHEAGWR